MDYSAKSYCEGKGIKGMSKEYLDMGDQLLATFKEADTNDSGQLELDEVKVICEKNEFFKKMGVESVMKKLDVDKSNTISRDEYMHLFLISWGWSYATDKFADFRGDPKVNDVIRVLAEDGYDGKELRQFIQKKGFAKQNGTVDLIEFVQCYFNPLEER